jgi:formylglycine-generating enzyme
MREIGLRLTMVVLVMFHSAMLLADWTCPNGHRHLSEAARICPKCGALRVKKGAKVKVTPSNSHHIKPHKHGSSERRHSENQESHKPTVVSPEPAKYKPTVVSPEPAKYKPEPPRRYSTTFQLKAKAWRSGVEMVYIPGGSFRIGDNDSSDWFETAKPVRAVTLSPYWLSKTPVTVAQFRVFTDDSGYRYDWKKYKPDWGWNAHPDYPMVNVSWDDAMAYCTWAGGTLPTEAQWERAAKGPRGTNYPWGDEWNKDLCVNRDNSNNQPAPVLRSDRMYQTSEGLLDMAGNVWQWCRDWHNEGYGFLKSNDPENTTQGQYRVLRGGSWLANTPGVFRSASRGYCDPGLRFYYVGFRLAGL